MFRIYQPWNSDPAMDAKGLQEFVKGRIILVNKPLEWTSFDVVNKLRNVLQKKLNRKLKVGHGGTLDPLATGLLIVCTGKATRLLSDITHYDKEYTGTLILGATTPSYDRETPIDQTYPTEDLTEELLHQAARQFTGLILQVPPAFSAVKVNGVRAYKKARRGHTVEMEPREVRIDSFELTEIRLPEVKFRVCCAKGVYIRSLVHDFGKALGCGAYLHQLCRTRIGPYRLEDAADLNSIIRSLNPDN
ncbi:MAG: tRNA pseudouridine synthase B [Chitinophagales bacterium]|nr:MAG: tRNA pseudouridine synthase B [Chitinophagales bacterium]